MSCLGSFLCQTVDFSQKHSVNHYKREPRCTIVQSQTTKINYLVINRPSLFSEYIPNLHQSSVLHSSIHNSSCLWVHFVRKYILSFDKFVKKIWNFQEESVQLKQQWPKSSNFSEDTFRLVFFRYFKSRLRFVLYAIQIQLQLQFLFCYLDTYIIFQRSTKLGCFVLYSFSNINP